MFSFDNIANAASILGLIISIWTLITTRSVKKRMVYNAEHDIFKNNLQDNCDRIEGFIESINSGIYLSDGDRTFKPMIRQFLTKIESQFSFLSYKTVHQIKTIYKTLESQNLSPDDWNKISEALIRLENDLKREDIR